MLSLNVVGFARLPLAEHKDLQLMSIINTRLLAKSTTSLKSPNPFVCRYLSTPSRSNQRFHATEYLGMSLHRVSDIHSIY
jgi:hypothetical protein